MKAYQAGTAPPLRFPMGTPVRCFVSEDTWVTGKIVAHNYREEGWPALQMAPYQILLDDEHVRGSSNAIWAPADIDDIIQHNFRFKLTDAIECRVQEDEWARCTVVGILYREPSWPMGQYAPYQVRVDGPLPGALATSKAHELTDKLIWLPVPLQGPEPVVIRRHRAPNRGHSPLRR